ncbi:MAG TPA: CHAT domain-containing protein [Flavilitoribacter sp.]|nr:CHAT domain-containing protein [Flavilitoribacter sp.]
MCRTFTVLALALLFSTLIPEEAAAQTPETALRDITVEELQARAPDAPSELIRSLLEKNDLHIYYAEYPEALTAVNRAEELAFSTPGIDSLLQAEVMLCKSRTQRTLGKLKGARSGFIRTLSLCGADRPVKASALMDLAHLDSEYGFISSSDSLFLSAEAILQKHPYTDSSDIVGYYITKGHLFYGKSRNDSAAVYYSKALSLNRSLHPEGHLSTAMCLAYLADQDLIRNNPKGAEKKLDEAEAMFGQLFRKPHPEMAYLYQIRGNLEAGGENFEAGKSYYQKAINLTRSYFDETYPNLAWLYIQLSDKTSNFWLEIDTMMLAGRYLDKALELNLNNFGEKSLPCAYTLLKIGKWNSTIANAKESILYLDKALAVYSGLEGSYPDQVSEIYRTLGHDFSFLGDYNKALLYFDRSFEILETEAGDNQYALMDACLLLASGHPVFEKKIEYTQKAIALARSIYGENHIMTVTYNFMLGAYYQLAGRSREGIPIMEQWIDPIRKSFIGKVPLIMVALESLLADAYLAVNDPVKAREVLQDVKKNADKLGDKESFVKGSFMGFQTRLYAQLGEWEEALKISENALKDIGYKPGKLQEVNFSKANSTVNLLHSRAGVLLDLYLAGKKDIAYLRESRQLLMDAESLINHIRQQLNIERDQGQLYGQVFMVYELLIKVNLEMSKIEKTDKNIEEAFLCLEKAKFSTILQTFQESGSSSVHDVPDSLITKEHWLKKQIKEWEKRGGGAAVGLSMGSLLPQQPDKKAVENLFILREQLDDLVNTFKKDYPDYYRLKTQPGFTSIQSLREKSLAEDQTLLEYYVADTVIYAFLIRKDHFEVIPLKKDPGFEDLVYDFRKGMIAFFTSEDRPDTLYQSCLKTYTRTAHDLYTDLIAPLKEKLTKKITIIPDAVLNYLPFEALLTEAPPVYYRINSFKYFMEDHIIQYDYSATLFAEATEGPRTPFDARKLAAFAPDFKAMNGEKKEEPDLRQDPLKPLKYNIPEAREIAALCNGQVFTDTSATLQNFIATADSFETLHCSTHAVLDRKGTEFSYLVFYSPSGNPEAGLLFAQDIYGLKLNKNAMVVLSACDTGNGPLSRTEGLASIARAFMYAGAKTIIPTLWSIDDEKTKELMVSFYQYLKAGLPKDEALWQAKKDYIRNNPGEKAHPYFWSAFIGIGDMR